MHRARDQVEASERARWLIELAGAVAQAQKLAWSLGVVDGDDPEARELYARLEAIQTEIDSLRFSDWVDVRTEIDPKWVDSLLTRGEPPLAEPR